MKKIWAITIVCAILSGTVPTAWAGIVAPPISAPSGLSLLELKVTGDEFLVLQNNGTTAVNDLSSYWLTAYNNVNPISAGVSSSTQQLPTAALQPGQTLLLSANPMQTCGASVAGKLSLSLGDSGGFLQLSRVALSANGAVSQTSGDLVSWSSTASGNIQNWPSNTKDPKAMYYRYLNGNSYAWQQADVDPSNFCQLNIVVAGGSGSSSAVTPLTLAATSPPATILGTVEAGDLEAVAQLPAADIGLNAAQLSELLPNPTGTGNDSTDEFIELYNPNAKAFDLTGFTLQSGTTTTHDYVFPSGSTIPASSFKVFYADDTKLSLSNTSGQVSLLDPFGNLISTSGLYEKAKDGYTWAVAQGKWYWTTEATPGKANVIKQPAVKKAKASSKTSKKSTKTTATKGAHTTLATGTTASNQFGDADQTSTIHPWVLALVGSLALLYGAYEYRRDITNRLYWLRAKLGARQTNRPKPAGRRSD